jgi:hypothetical protein
MKLRIRQNILGNKVFGILLALWALVVPGLFAFTFVENQKIDSYFYTVSSQGGEYGELKRQSEYNNKYKIVFTKFTMNKFDWWWYYNAANLVWQLKPLGITLAVLISILAISRELFT